MKNTWSRTIFGLSLPLAFAACGSQFNAPALETEAEPEIETVPPAPTEPAVLPDPAELLERALRIASLGGHPELVTRLVDSAAQIAPLHPRRFEVRAVLAERRENWGEAAEHWQEVVRLEPDYRTANDRLAITSMRRDLAVHDFSTNGGVFPVEQEPRPGPILTAVAVGDIQLGMGWPESRRRLPPEDARPVFQRIQDSLRTGDIVFGNLETVLADTGQSTKCRAGSRNCFAFRAPTAHANTLRRSGFTVLSINNNHSGDFGNLGRRTTIQALDNAGLLHSGPTSGVASWETKGLKIALIAFSTGGGPYRVQDIENAKRTVAEADRAHDVVIVSFHGGAEGQAANHVPKRVEHAFGENRGDVYAFAHGLVDAGADLILGHGPHVLRGVEIYKGRFIAYSLGNFSSWRTFSLRGNLGISAILRVSFAINGVVTEAELIPVVLEDPGIPTLDPQRRAISIIRNLSETDFSDPVFDVHGRYRRPIAPTPVP